MKNAGEKNGLSRLGLFLGLLFMFSAMLFGLLSNAFPSLLLNHPSGEKIATQQLEILFATQSIILFGALAAYFFTNKIVKNSRPYPSALNSWHPGVLIGILTGLILFTATIILIWTFGSIDIEYNGLTESILVYLLLFILVAVSEELIFRLYILNILLEDYNRAISIVISSCLFASMHTLNSSVSVVGIVNIFLFGVLASVLFLKYNSIYISMAFHFLWNICQGPIFGIEVSGFKTNSIYSLKMYGGVYLTGGSFGIEGSLILTMLFTILISILTLPFKIISHNKITMTSWPR